MIFSRSNMFMTLRSLCRERIAIGLRTEFVLGEPNW